VADRRESEVWDLAIIGGGAAGLTCAIYAGRGRLKTVVLEKAMPGGQVVLNHLIENYPGFADGVSGLELAQHMHRQAVRFGAELRIADVTGIAAERPFRVETSTGALAARAVLIATGCSPRKLGIPGENEYFGRGVSYCATCDGPLFPGKAVVVVGGGNTALDDALFLVNTASEVTVVHRRDRLRGDPILQERAFASPRIRFLWKHVPIEIRGDESVEALVAKHVDTGGERELAAAAVFIAVGEIPQAGFLPEQVRRDESGHVIADSDFQTSVKGMFVAGDVRAGAYRQIAAAVGEGVLAYRSIREYLERM
jgi:thioredoxin reductase (NADPH)